MALIQLPPPRPPMTTRVFSLGIEDNGIVEWSVDKPHPLVSGFQVVRMFPLDDGGVEVYAVSTAGAVRHRLAASRVLFTEEVMPHDVLAEEIAASEGDDDDDDDDNGNAGDPAGVSQESSGQP